MVLVSEAVIGISKSADIQRTPTPTLHGDRVTLRAPGEGELADLARIVATDPEASPWWGRDAEKILGWFTDADATTFVVDVDAHPIGVIMYEESGDPDIDYAAIDVTLTAPWVGQGLGRDALRTLASHLLNVSGTHRLTIDPSVRNQRAIRSYASVGFQPVGVMRQYERYADGWHDALLMDLLADDLRSR